MHDYGELVEANTDEELQQVLERAQHLVMQPDVWESLKAAVDSSSFDEVEKTEFMGFPVSVRPTDEECKKLVATLRMEGVVAVYLVAGEDA